MDEHDVWKYRKFMKAVTLTMAVVIALTWCYLLKYGPATSIRIDSGPHHGQRRFDIVLSRFQENPSEVSSAIAQVKKIPSIATLDPRVIVYNKGGEPVSDWIALREALGADVLYTLPNVGREGDAYLTHIIDHYDELADHTLFLQAGIENLGGIQELFDTRFKSTLGVMSFNSYTTCSCDACVAPKYPNIDLTHGYKRIPQLYTLFNEDFCPPTGLLLSFRAQFVVSRPRIIRNAKPKWELLRTTLRNMSHFVHDDPTEEQNLFDSTAKNPNNPFFLHTLERAWMILFGCNDLRIMDCSEDSLVSSYQNTSMVCGCDDEDFHGIVG